MNYHGKMMNVQITEHNASLSYRYGFRDARHACAEIANEADAEIATLRARVAELEGLARACLPVVRHKEYTEAASGNPPEAARWRDLADRINAAIAPKEAQ